jgi:hypothetical protein
VAVRRSIDDAHENWVPEGVEPAAEADDADPRDPIHWAVSASDDGEAYEAGLARIVLTVEEVGRPGAGLIAHLSPESARRLRTALRDALREVGADPGT